jgi:hypothetical protein
MEKEGKLGVMGETSEQKENSNLVMCRLWSPDSWDLSDTQEVYIPKETTLNDLSQLLQAIYPGTQDNLCCTKINSAWNFHRVQLPFENWETLLNN